VSAQALTLLNEQHGYQVVAKSIWPWCKAHLQAGRKVVIEARLAEDVLTDKQRKYLHGFILKTIAAQAAPNGQKFPMEVWKEHIRAQFLGFKTVTTKNPLTGKKVRRRQRVSTEDLGVKGYSEYIDRVAAWAVTDLGVEFVDEWVDPDTGEIYRLSEMRQHGRKRKPAPASTTTCSHCGHQFPEHLGAHGCPNCHGEGECSS